MTVTAGATMIETRSTAVGSVVSQEQIVGLPLDGRQASQLVLLSGAAVTQAGGLIGSQREYPSAVAISVAGGTGNSTIYLVDGAFNNDPGQQHRPADAVSRRARRVQGRNRRASGALRHLHRRHGERGHQGRHQQSARQPLRVPARSPLQRQERFATVDDGLSRHQMGGTVGGPIKQNRMFFFGALQYARNRQRPTDTQAFVPTAAMLNGDFTQVASAACNNGTALALPTPFVNNRIDPSQFNPIGMHIVRLLPSTTDPCGRITYTVPDNNDEQQVVSRIDWQATNDQRIFGRYFVANFDRAPGYEGSNLLLASGTGLGLDNRVQTLSLGDDYVLSQNLVSATRFAYARSRIHRSQGDELPSFTDLGSNVWSAATEPGLRFFNLAVTNGFPTAGFPGRVRIGHLSAVAGLRLGEERAPDLVWRQLDPAGTRRHRSVPGQRHLHVQRHARRRRPSRACRPDARPAESVSPGRQSAGEAVAGLLRRLHAGRVARERQPDAQRRPALGAVYRGDR